ncbi:MAG: TonB-dependent receptor [Acidobacteriota bacterium]|nr:TonB-dependent receptor [Acidobacteriota bacterium]
MKISIRVTGVLALFLAIPAFAHDGPQDPATSALEELLQTPISTAAKYEQHMSDVAASVTVISAEEIARYGWRTLAEVLASVRGVHTTYDRGYTYLGVRGIGLPSDYNNRFLVLIDGVEMTESVSGSVGIDTALAVDLSTLSRIEFVRGPGSVMYGTGAMFGVINLITKDEGERSSMAVGGGSAGLRTGAARVAMHAGELKGAVAVSWQDRKGRDLYFAEFDAPETNHGIVRDGDADRYRSVVATAAWRDVRFLALSSTRTKSVPTASWYTTFGGGQKITDGRTLLALNVTRRLGAGRTIVARAYNDRFDYHGLYPNSDGGYQDRSSSSRTGAEIRHVWDIVPTQRLTTGVEYSANRIATYEWSSERGDQSVGTPYKNLSLYAQMESRISKRVTLTAGGSYDKASNAAGRFTPRGALIVRAWPAATLKLLYGQAFRSPSIYELDYTTEGFLLSEDLRAEEIRTLELVWEQKLTPSVLMTASLFDETVTDLIRLQPLPSGEIQFQNRSDAHSRGFELQVDSRRNDGIWSYASYSWQRVHEVDERMVNSPLYTLKAGVSTPTSRRLYGGLEMQYEGQRLTYGGQETDAALLTNLNIGGLIHRSFGASVAIRNLFDVNYATPGGVEHRQDMLEQDGRSFTLMLKWTGN